MNDEAARIPILYERHAAAFDRLRGRDLIERHWLDRLTRDLPAGGDILDIGCGSGEPIAADLLARGFRLTGIDTSPSLIALCRDRFAQAVWHVGDMRQLDLGQRFDALVAWHSFLHLSAEDQRAMFPRFAAHAREGARLLFTSGAAAGIKMGALEGEPLFHASLDPQEYRDLLAEHGFSVIDFISEDTGCGDATVWLARCN